MEGDKGRIGASFTAFLDEHGILEDVEAQAVKALIAEQISVAMRGAGRCRRQNGKIGSHTD
jgi:hypothetical protein